MQVKHTDEDLQIITGWYDSAAGESASGLGVSPKEHWKEEYYHRFEEAIAHAHKVKALLDKLQIAYNDHDVYLMEQTGLL